MISHGWWPTDFCDCKSASSLKEQAAGIRCRPLSVLPCLRQIDPFAHDCAVKPAWPACNARDPPPDQLSNAVLTSQGGRRDLRRTVWLPATGALPR